MAIGCPGRDGRVKEEEKDVVGDRGERRRGRVEKDTAKRSESITDEKPLRESRNPLL